MKRRRVLVITVLSVVVLIGGFLIMINNTKPSNVFDEMYLSVESPRKTGTRFAFVKPLGTRGLSKDMGSDYYYGGVYRSSLAQGDSISVGINTDKKDIIVITSRELSNEQRIMITYIYTFKTKTLRIKPVKVFNPNYKETGVDTYIEDAQGLKEVFDRYGVDRAMIEQLRDYFLYDKLLTDWVVGNGERSLFDTGDFGHFTIEDNIFDTLEEIWPSNLP